MTIVAPTYGPPLSSQDILIMLFLFFMMLVGGWAVIELLIGILQLLFVPKQSDVRKNASKRIKKAFLVLVVNTVLFFLLGSFLRAPYIID